MKQELSRTRPGTSQGEQRDGYGSQLPQTTRGGVAVLAAVVRRSFSPDVRSVAARVVSHTARFGGVEVVSSPDMQGVNEKPEVPEDGNQ